MQIKSLYIKIITYSICVLSKNNSDKSYVLISNRRYGIFFCYELASSKDPNHGGAFFG